MDKSSRRIPNRTNTALNLNLNTGQAEAETPFPSCSMKSPYRVQTFRFPVRIFCLTSYTKMSRQFFLLLKWAGFQMKNSLRQPSRLGIVKGTVMVAEKRDWETSVMEDAISGLHSDFRIGDQVSNDFLITLYLANGLWEIYY